jgi:hypothetical protein
MDEYTQLKQPKPLRQTTNRQVKSMPGYVAGINLSGFFPGLTCELETTERIQEPLVQLTFWRER